MFHVLPAFLLWFISCAIRFFWLESCLLVRKVIVYSCMEELIVFSGVLPMLYGRSENIGVVAFCKCSMGAPDVQVWGWLEDGAQGSPPDIAPVPLPPAIPTAAPGEAFSSHPLPSGRPGAPGTAAHPDTMTQAAGVAFSGQPPQRQTSLQYIADLPASAAEAGVAAAEATAAADHTAQPSRPLKRKSMAQRESGAAEAAAATAVQEVPTDLAPEVTFCSG